MIKHAVRYAIVLICLGSMVACKQNSGNGGESTRLETEDQKTLYALGLLIGRNVKPFALKPEELVGRTIVIVANLKPAKLMGIESNGMVLAASPDGGKPTLVSFDGDVPPGSRIR